ncbi:hypothetical protein [Alteromonas sp. D210916BOD_24]
MNIQQGMSTVYAIHHYLVSRGVLIDKQLYFRTVRTKYSMADGFPY